MKIGNFSSLSQHLFGRRWSARLRDDITKSRYELTKGRRFDMSADLGYRVSHLVDVNIQTNSLDNYLMTNGFVAKKMSIAQDSLSSLYVKKGEKSGPLLAYLEAMSVSKSDNSVAAIQALAKAGLGALASTLNVEFNGEYIFGGENVKQAPLKDMSKALEKIKKAFDTFLAGKDVSNLTPADMNKFLSSDVFNNFFKGHGWQENFSNASDKLDKTRISETGETINNGVSFNSEAFKETIKGLVMGAVLLSPHLSRDTRSFLLLKSQSIMQGASLQGINEEQVRLGASQNRIKQASDVMKARINVLKTLNLDLGSVDPDAAATTESELETALNLSYQLTTRLAKLSLINYL